MTYQKPGYFEVPSGQLLPTLCEQIKGSSLDFETDLAKVVEKLGKAGRKVKSITLEDVVSVAGEGNFAPRSSGLRAFQHVMLRFLHSLGVVPEYPAVVGYARSPKLSIEQCAQRMVEVGFPSFTDLGGDMTYTVEVLKTTFPTIVREIAARARLTRIYVDRLRLRLGDIGFKIATGKPIDQAERSFFCAFSNPDVDQACTADELKAGNIRRDAFIIAESGDPLVSAAWERFKQVTEAGPFLRFYRMVSNRNFESLMYWLGPLQQQLVFPIGYPMKYGPFLEFRGTAAFALPWTQDDQLTASRERCFTKLLPSIGGGMARNVPFVATTMTGMDPTPMWDLPQVDIRVDMDGTSSRPQEYSFFSPWRNRKVSSRYGFDPQDLLIDLALTQDSLGEGASSGIALDSFSLVDFDMSVEAGYLPNDNKPYRLSDKEWLTPVVYPSERQGELQLKNVDMRPFYQRMGTTMLPPAFREYCMVPVGWLYAPDPEAEKYIVARLGLTYERALQAERVIRLSHNYYKLLRLLPRQTQLPVDEARLRVLIRVMCGLPTDAAIKE